MTPEQRRRVEELYEQLTGRSVPDQIARLNEFCDDDGEVRAEVLLLLGDGSQGSTASISRLGKVSTEQIYHAFNNTCIDRLRDPLIGKSIGPYHVLGLLSNSGGMGTVYKAE